MRPCHLIPFSFCLLFLHGCKKVNEADAAKQQQEDFTKIAQEVKEEGSAELKKRDIPILPMSVGDQWTYSVTLQLPKDVQVKESPMLATSFERKRTYIGKVKPRGMEVETDCFEIEAPGSPIEREFIEFDEEQVKMRGSEIVGHQDSLPVWLEPAVLLVRAGVVGGESMPPIQFKDPSSGTVITRYIQIIGREKVVAAGRDFSTIRILMSGKDGDVNPIELRRIIWFAPHFGIVKEEKLRYLNDELLMKETVELKSMQLKNDPDANKGQ